MMAEYELGKWDLSELAKNPKSPAFQKQIKDLENQAKKFENLIMLEVKVQMNQRIILEMNQLTQQFQVNLKN